MSVKIELCETLPSRAALDDVLGQYYALIYDRMAQMGVHLPPDAAASALNEFWDNAHDYLPPDGCLVVARDASGAIVGCGMMKCLDAETGELKRLFVSDSARGTGAGRRLVEARIDAARAMGLKRLVADTLSPNVEMRALYPKLGFTELSEPFETTTHRDQPMLRPHMHYFMRDLTLDA